MVGLGGERSGLIGLVTVPESTLEGLGAQKKPVVFLEINVIPEVQTIHMVPASTGNAKAHWVYGLWEVAL